MTAARAAELNVELLIKLLAMTGSSHDSEALSAMRLANAQLAKAGVAWSELLRGKVTVIVDPFGDLPQPRPATAQKAPAPPMPAPRPMRAARTGPSVPPSPDPYSFAAAAQQHRIRVRKKPATTATAEDLGI